MDFTKSRSAIRIYSVSSKDVMIKQCNAITTKNEFNLYRKSRENKDEKKLDRKKLIKSPKNCLAGALWFF